MRVKCLLLCLFLLVTLAPPCAAVSTSAKAAVLLDLENGRLLYGQNADTRLAMASTTKIMTALVVAEQCDLDRMVKVGAETTGVYGSSMYLKAGEELTIEQLLYGLLLQSGNDAASTLAVAVAGSERAFVSLMNEKAAALGLKDTHFANPHGLDAEGHYTTARELALMAAALLKHEKLAAIVASKTAKVGGRTLSNHNRLLSMVDGADGVKTGFTDDAGRCLVSSATRDGQTLIAVTLNDGDDWRDHKTLLEYGFQTFKKRQFARVNSVAVTLPVVGGAWPEVDLVPEAPLSYPLTDTELEGCESQLLVPRFVYADVAQGQRAGWLVVLRDGKELLRTALLYDREVRRLPAPEPSTWQRFTAWLGDLFS